MSFSDLVLMWLDDNQYKYTSDDYGPFVLVFVYNRRNKIRGMMIRKDDVEIAPDNLLGLATISAMDKNFFKKLNRYIACPQRI